MSTVQRGRNAPANQRGRRMPVKKRSRAPLYGLLALLAILGFVGTVLYVQNRETPIDASAISVEQAIKPFNAPVGRTDDGFYYKGSPDAPVKVIEYADFQCPGCGAFFRNQEANFTKAYVETGKVQFIYHELPIQNHRNAIPAASAARCAADQDPQQFWRMHDVLFSRQAEWSGDANPTRRFTSYAGELGLDEAAFSACMTNGTHTQAIQDAGAAAAAVGARATPTFSVDGQLVTLNQGTELQQAVDAALAAKGQ